MAKRRNENAISLFPFLAVLVCTMGALILLLLVTTRRIRQKQQEAPAAVATDDSAESPSVVTATPVTSDAEQVDEVPAVAMSAWLEAQATLLTARQELAEAERALDDESQQQVVLQNTLDDQRQQLAELAEALQAVRRKHETATQGTAVENEQLEQLRLRQAQLQQELQQQQQRTQQAATELANAESLAEAAEQLVSQRHSALRALRDLSQQQAATTSDTGTDQTLIEFSNSAGTSRTPIVIDVNGEGYLFPASQITVRPRDMEGVSATDNPLLSGVLAVHRHRSEKSVTSRPYVLLLVRPAGALDFYTAQRVFDASRVHFGYELIAQDEEVAAAEPADGEADAVRVAVLNALMRRESYYAARSSLQRRIDALKQAQRAQSGRGGGGGRSVQDTLPEGFAPETPAAETFGADEGVASGPPRAFEGDAEPAQGMTAQGQHRVGDSTRPPERSSVVPTSPGDDPAGRYAGRGQGPVSPWSSIPSKAEARSHVEQGLARALAAREEARTAEHQYQAATPSEQRTAAPGQEVFPSLAEDSRSSTETRSPGGVPGPRSTSRSGGAVQGSGQPGPSGQITESWQAAGSDPAADSSQLTQQPVRFPQLDGQTYRPHDTSPGAAAGSSGPGGMTSGSGSGLSRGGMVSYHQVTVFLDPQHYTVAGYDSVPLHGQSIRQIVHSLLPVLYEVSGQHPHPLAETTLPAAKFVVSPGAHTLFLQLAAALSDRNLPVSSVVSLESFVSLSPENGLLQITPTASDRVHEVSERRVLP